MGIYLNPDNRNFAETVRSSIYVDKTGMIAVINHLMDEGRKYICLSLPRRFGKTITGNMLAAYYSRGCDSRELFSPYEIAEDPAFSDKLNRYNVIQIDMNSEYQNTWNKADLIRRLSGKIKQEIGEEYPEISFGEEDSLADCILKVFSAAGDPFVIIMDEYDVLVREQVSSELFEEYLSFLNGLFKSNTLRPAIALAYMTGILPIVRDKVQSKLNNFEEYTILDAGELAGFVGFTEEEVRTLCAAYSVDFEECRNWYDGYSQHGYEIYNPESVVKAVRRKEFAGYWGRTSTYEAISERIRLNFSGTREDVIRMLAGEAVEVNVTRYMNTMTSFHTRSDLFTYLIYLGYLSYERESGTCRIPNKEVRQEWINAIETEEGYEVTNQIIEESRQLLEETLRGNEEAVANALELSHIHVTSNRSYNNEDALQSAIYLAYLYALNEYTVVKEMTAGKGFADVVFLPRKPDRPAFIVELKRNKTPESALNQIKEKKYFECLHHYQGELLLVGINYDEDSKAHTCKIERWQAFSTGWDEKT